MIEKTERIVKPISGEELHQNLEVSSAKNLAAFMSFILFSTTILIVQHTK